VKGNAVRKRFENFAVVHPHPGLRNTVGTGRLFGITAGRRGCGRLGKWSPPDASVRSGFLRFEFPAVDEFSQPFVHGPAVGVERIGHLRSGERFVLISTPPENRQGVGVDVS
jgi:hypothetical protein